MSAKSPRYPRHLPIEGTHNFRDVGGYPTADGGVTRWGTLFRSDSLHALTDTGHQALIDLGIRSSIDLRDDGEVSERPSRLANDPQLSCVQVPVVGPELFPRTAGGVRSLGEAHVWRLENAKASFLRALETLASRSYPAVVNCSAGKDRTGLVMALVLGILDVSPESIIEDYALTKKYAAKLLEPFIEARTAEGVEWILGCAPEDMEQALDHLDRRYGGAEGYVREIGLSEEAVGAIRSALVGPAA